MLSQRERKTAKKDHRRHLYANNRASASVTPKQSRPTLSVGREHPERVLDLCKLKLKNSSPLGVTYRRPHSTRGAHAAHPPTRTSHKCVRAEIPPQISTCLAATERPQLPGHNRFWFVTATEPAAHALGECQSGYEGGESVGSPGALVQCGSVVQCLVLGRVRALHRRIARPQILASRTASRTMSLSTVERIPRCGTRRAGKPPLAAVTVAGAE
jgi:hypothetical protein